MSIDTWALILAALSAIVSVFFWLYRNPEWEWRRIYLRAAGGVGPGNEKLRDAFKRVVRDAGLWEQAAPLEMEPGGREEALFRELLEAELGGFLSAEAEDALGRFYEAVRLGLAGGSTRWRERARQWNVTPGGAPAVAPALMAAEPRAADWSLPPSNLPEPDGVLIGRPRELEDWCGLLRGDARLVTVTGMGGVGKTHLCMHISHALRPHFANLVYWVDLAAIPPGEHELVAARIAQTFGLEPEETLAPRARPGKVSDESRRWLDAFVRRLRDARLLLYLDNFEHVSEAAADVEYLLDGCPRLSVLVSSHRPLKILGREHERRLGPLSLPAGESPTPRELEASGAAQLFVERARKRLKDFQLTEENSPHVMRICSGFEGLPYTIEIAAAKIKYYGGSARKLSESLFDPEGHLALFELRNQKFGVAERQKDPRVLTAWSYVLLRPEEQSVFRRLAVFNGAFSRAAAESVAADAETAGEFRVRLDSLIDDSLLDVTAEPEGELRYSMVLMTRECALEILGACGELDATRRRHAEFFLSLSEREVARLNDAKDEALRVAVLDGLGRERDNLRGAFRWALAEDAALALRLALALSFYLDARGQRPEARAALDDALALDGEGDGGVRRAALDRAALLAVKQADCECAERYAQELLTLSSGAGDVFGEARALHRQGRARFYRGDYKGARVLLGRSHEKFLSLGETAQLAWVKFDLGDAARDVGELTLAREEYRKGLELLELSGAGDGQEKGTIYVNLAFVCHKLGDEVGAREGMAEAERHLRGQGYFRWYLHFHGRLDADALDLDAACEHFRQSYEIFLARYDKLGIIRSLLGFSLVAAKRDDWRGAARLLGAESALRGQMGREFPPDWDEEKSLIKSGAREDRLGVRGFAEAFEAGQAVTWEQALAPDWYSLIVEPKPATV